MTIKKVNGKYRLDIRPDGVKGKRVIKLFDTQSQARQFKNQLLSGRFDSKAVQANDEKLRLNDLINSWYELHGRSLKSSVDTKNRLLKLSEKLGNPLGSLVNPESFAQYRKQRIDNGINPATLNRELITLKALFRELKRLSVIDYEPAILKVRKLREKKLHLSYLSETDLIRLNKQVDQSTNESLWFVFTICLITGARWSEAEGLTLSNCINNGFQFVDTKNGYSRFVPVDSEIFDVIRSRLAQGPFMSCYSAFRSAMKRTGLTVPKGQMAHILRHTFASYFVMRGGNLIALQKILGHSSLNITMRYSHLAPDYLNQAIEFNPLARKYESGKNLERIAVDIKKPVEHKILTG